MAGGTVAVRWQTWAGDGLEHLVLTRSPDGIAAESVLIGPGFAARYSLACDASWRTRRVVIALLGGPTLALVADGGGRWADADSGAPVLALDGALDPDLSASPFTNTLPIRRLALGRGESHEIVTAYVSFPDLTVTPDRQRYTCLAPGRLWRYESVDSDFAREIEVDGEGLVLTYPGLFRRAPIGPEVLQA